MMSNFFCEFRDPPLDLLLKGNSVFASLLPKCSWLASVKPPLFWLQSVHFSLPMTCRSPDLVLWYLDSRACRLESSAVFAVHPTKLCLPDDSAGGFG